MAEMAIPALMAFAAAVVTTRLVERHSRARGLLDRPNDRSSHEIPTPRIGGVGIIVGVAAGWVLIGGWRDPTWVSLVAGAVVLALVGLADDLGRTSLIGKYLAQVVSAALVTLGHAPTLAFDAGGTAVVIGGPVAAVLTVVWLTALINAFNFIDGIDGMLGWIVAVVGVAGVALVGPPGHANLIVVAAAALGFLVWNHPPASIFMGDVGSQFLGLWVGAGLLRSADGSTAVVPILLLFSLVLFDTGSTLVRRAIAGKNLFAAHREHLYQRLVATGFSHRAISAAYAIVTALLGAAAVAWSGLSGPVQVLVLLAVAIGAGALVVATRRAEEDRRPG